MIVIVRLSVFVTVCALLKFLEARIAEPLEDFPLIYGATADFTFHDLFQGSERAERVELEQSLAARVAPVDSELWHDTLLPLEKGRRLGYLEWNMRDIDEARALPGDPSVFDLENNPDSRPRRVHGSEPGTPMFCLVSHGTLWNEKLGRPMLLEEWLETHMVPYSDCTPQWWGRSLDVPCDFLGLVESQDIRPGTLKSAIGNGWHIGLLSAWIMHVLSSTEFAYTADDEPELWPHSQCHLQESLDLRGPPKGLKESSDDDFEYGSPPKKRRKLEDDTEDADATASSTGSPQSGEPWLESVSSAAIPSARAIEVEDSPSPSFEYPLEDSQFE